MDNNAKIAVGFFVMTGIAIGSLTLAVKQELQIDKLTKENKSLRSVNDVISRIGATVPEFRAKLVDVITLATDIPDDISTL